MKAVFTLLALISTVFASPCWARRALPPLYESVRYYNTLLNSKELSSSIEPAEWVASVQLSSKGTFTVITNKSILIFKVSPESKARADGKVGPKRLKVELLERKQRDDLELNHSSESAFLWLFGDASDSK